MPNDDKRALTSSVGNIINIFSKYIYDNKGKSRNQCRFLACNVLMEFPHIKIVG